MIVRVAKPIPAKGIRYQVDISAMSKLAKSKITQIKAALNNPMPIFTKPFLTFLSPTPISALGLLNRDGII